MFITAVCFIFLIKLRWPKTKSLYETQKLKFLQYIWTITPYIICIYDRIYENGANKFKARSFFTFYENLKTRKQVMGKKEYRKGDK